MQASTIKRAWWTGEQAVLLAAVPQHLSPRVDGQRISVSTIYRWTVVGAHGVRLRRFRTGPRGWCTTLEELHRFAAAMTAIAGGDV